MILCTVNTYEKTVTLTSLLRDTLVQYPNYTDTNGKNHSGGKIKLTSIYHNGYICTNSTADAMGLMNLTLYRTSVSKWTMMWRSTLTPLSRQSIWSAA